MATIETHKQLYAQAVLTLKVMAATSSLFPHLEGNIPRLGHQQLRQEQATRAAQKTPYTSPMCMPKQSLALCPLC